MLDKTILKILTQKVNLPEKGIINTIELLNSGATIPFIARYRKEVTGSFDEVDILTIDVEYKKLVELAQRKTYILTTIEEQGKLTDELRAKIENCYDGNILEDLYLPYKKKRKTKADKAREMGLQGLADFILNENRNDPNAESLKYINDLVLDEASALQGALDIVAETISEHEETRSIVRNNFERNAVLSAEAIESKKSEAEKYKDYFEYGEKLTKAPSHRVLAVFRGEAEEFLRLKIRPQDEDGVIERLERKFVRYNNDTSNLLRKGITSAYKRLVAPSIENEFRKSVKDKADEEAIQVFAQNLEQLLLQAPLGEKSLIAVDPGYRTGCKVAVLSQSGDLLYHTTIYPHPPQNQLVESTETIAQLIKKFEIQNIATGNGTAGKETYDWLQREFGHSADIYMVNESGASIYSASEIAREEFPDADVTVRGTVSIGRRLMDPLSELVKIDPKSIGVGQYQHDVNQIKLKGSLDNTTVYCVNKVGVQLNTAGKQLLSFVSGIGPTLAENIINFRKNEGSFSSRKDLLKVPGMGPKTYELCAGFLKVKNGANALDNTSVHPESYHVVEKMAEKLNCSIDELTKDAQLRKKIRLEDYITDKIGMPTLKDIINELEKPGLDPRGKAEPVKFSNKINSIADLHEGMNLPGIVTNITNFGAFVDLGIKESALLHISQISNTFIKHPSEKLQLNQEVNVTVIEVDLERKRVSLSMIQ